MMRTSPGSKLLTYMTIVGWLVLSASGVGAGDDPVKLSVNVAPEPVAAGAPATVTVVLTPNAGYKINRYPKIKLMVPGVDGLVGEAATEVGNASPPPPDQLEANYFKKGVDPLELRLEIDPAAGSGRHEIPAQLRYFYCVEKSGYCAPARAEVKIPVVVGPAGR